MVTICVAFVACDDAGGAVPNPTKYGGVGPNSSSAASSRPASSCCGLPGLGLALMLAPLGNLGDELADNRLAKRLEIPRHHDKGAGAADDIGAIITIEPARRIGVFWIPWQRSFTQDRQSIDRDALRHGLIAQFGHIAPGIIGAVAGNIDGPAARAKWRAGKLGHSKFDGAADRSAIGERARRLQQAVAEILRR